MKRLDETRMVGTVNKLQKPKLLSPVSSYESAVSVIDAGVDEIYCGVKIPGIKYLAISNRPSWCSLSNDRELEKVVNYAHVHGVDTIVTTEFPFMARVIEKNIRGHIRSCVDKGVDAIIASDIGVLLLIKEMDIDIPVYASTYLASMNYEAVDFLRKLDVKRVILERHLTINEIQDIAHKSKGVEIEIFIHGSGCSNINANCYGCTMLIPASYLRARSRESKQPSPAGLTLCTIPYDIYEMGDEKQKIASGPVLDAFTFCSLCQLPELLQTGVTGFKIVGRCMPKEFQERTARVYRRLIDLIESCDMESFKRELNEIIRGDIIQEGLCKEKRCYYTDFLHVPNEIPIE